MVSGQSSVHPTVSTSGEVKAHLLIGASVKRDGFYLQV